jgi:hypothetical protein
MIQALGEGPERLLRQADGSFSMRSQPESHIRLAVENGRATMAIDPSPFGVPMVGERLGPGDPQTFHRGP